MSEPTEIGRVAPWAGPRSQRSGTPESRSQLEELRSGERVTELVARPRPRRQDPPGSRVVRS